MSLSDTLEESVGVLGERRLLHAVVMESEQTATQAVPLSEVSDDDLPTVRSSLEAYGGDRNPITALRQHQAAVLRGMHERGAPRHVLLTSSTGSGKSAAFWAWTIEQVWRAVRREPGARVH